MVKSEDLSTRKLSPLNFIPYEWDAANKRRIGHRDTNVNHLWGLTSLVRPASAVRCVSIELEGYGKEIMGKRWRGWRKLAENFNRKPIQKRLLSLSCPRSCLRFRRILFFHMAYTVLVHSSQWQVHKGYMGISYTKSECELFWDIKSR